MEPGGDPFVSHMLWTWKAAAEEADNAAAMETAREGVVYSTGVRLGLTRIVSVAWSTTLDPTMQVENPEDLKT